VDVCGPIRKAGIELHYHYFQKLLYEYLQIEFALTSEEQERIFWDNAAPGALTPNIVLERIK